MFYYKSRYTIVCCAAKKVTVDILIEEKKHHFHECIAPWPFLQSTPFLHYSCPPGRVGHTHTAKFAPAICEIWEFKV